MYAILFILCVLPLILILFKNNGYVTFNAFTFSIFHFFIYGMIGYTFPGPGASETIQFVVMTTAFFIFWGFLFGYAAASAISRAHTKTRMSHDFSLITENPKLKSAMVMFIGFTAAIGWFYFGGFPPIFSSIASLISGQLSFDSSVGVRDFRFAMTKAAYFGGEYRGQGVLRAITYTNSAIIVSYFSFVFAVWGTRKAALNLGASILFAFIFVGGVGDRGPFLEIILISAAACSIVNPLRAIKLFKIGAVSFLMLILLSSLSTKGFSFFQEEGFSGIFELIDSLVTRIFRGNSHYDFMIIELVDTGSWPLRWGSVHIRNIITAIPGINYGVPVSYELFSYFNPNSNNTTFLSGTYLTHTYLDFGAFGSVVIYTFVGMLVAFIARYASAHSRKSFIALLALPSLYFILGKVFVYGIPGLLPSMAILLIVLGVLKLFLSFKVNLFRLRSTF